LEGDSCLFTIKTGKRHKSQQKWGREKEERAKGRGFGRKISRSEVPTLLYCVVGGPSVFGFSTLLKWLIGENDTSDRWKKANVEYTHALYIPFNQITYYSEGFGSFCFFHYVFDFSNLSSS